MNNNHQIYNSDSLGGGSIMGEERWLLIHIIYYYVYTIMYYMYCIKYVNQIQLCIMYI